MTDENHQLSMLFGEYRDFLDDVVDRKIATRHWHIEPHDIASRVWITVATRLREGKITREGIDNWPGYLTTLANNEFNNAYRKDERARRGWWAMARVLPSPRVPEENLFTGIEREQRLALYAGLGEQMNEMMILIVEEEQYISVAARKVGMKPDKASKLLKALSKAVEDRENGRPVTGTMADQFTRFADGVRALRRERSGRD